jgi:DNA-binding transcriptional MerR regulator
MTAIPDHQSIGEVLAALRDDFPDITISKIRFLESQGLIDPERTPSGYRKFRDGDVARLRWILQQQKHNFLPLKVIKARLDAAGPDALPEDIDPATVAPGDGASEDDAAEATSAAAPKAATGEGASKRKRAPRAAKATRDPAPRRASGAAAKAKVVKSAPSPEGPALFESPTLPLDDGPDDDLGVDATGASLTRSELGSASGLTDVQLSELEEYGLLVPAAGSGARVVFDEDALVVAKLAAEFASHGIGPRHLRMFRVFAEREAGLYDQVIAPRLKRRNPDARAQARDDLIELARLGRALRAAFLRSSTAGLLRD